MTPEKVKLDELRNNQAFLRSLGGNVWIKLLGRACLNVINGTIESIQPNTLVYPVWITNIEYKYDQ